MEERKNGLKSEHERDEDNQHGNIAKKQKINHLDSPCEGSAPQTDHKVPEHENGAEKDLGSLPDERPVNRGRNRRRQRKNKDTSERQPGQRPNNKRRKETICMFYMKGGCKKGDNCFFSHDALPPRKMELCKFYLMSSCSKQNKCLFMHEDFPCKIFHSGQKCFAGDNCKFSHEELTDETRMLLHKYMSNGPNQRSGNPKQEDECKVVSQQACGVLSQEERKKPVAEKEREDPAAEDQRVYPAAEASEPQESSHEKPALRFYVDIL